MGKIKFVRLFIGFIAFFAFIAGCTGADPDDEIGSQTQESTANPTTTSTSLLPRFAGTEDCGDVREMTVDEWIFGSDVVVVGDVIKVEVSPEVFLSHSPHGLVDVTDCELNENFFPGLVVTINNVSVFAGEGELDEMNIVIGSVIMQSWSSQPTFLSGKLGWYGAGRIEPGMRIGGTLFKANGGSYTPRFYPLFQLSDAGLTFQADQQNCKKLPNEVKAIVDEANLSSLIGQRNISDEDLVSIKEESARDDSGDFVSYTASFCDLKGYSEPDDDDECIEIEGQPAVGCL